MLVELSNERQRPLFRRIEFEQLLQNFSGRLNFLPRDQAAGQSPSGRIKMGIVTLLARQLPSKIQRQPIQPILVGKREMPFCQGDIFVLEGQFGELDVSFQESAAVGNEIQQFVAGDLKFPAGANLEDLRHVQVAIERTFWGLKRVTISSQGL